MTAFGSADQPIGRPIRAQSGMAGPGRLRSVRFQALGGRLRRLFLLATNVRFRPIAALCLRPSTQSVAFAVLTQHYSMLRMGLNHNLVGRDAMWNSFGRIITAVLLSIILAALATGGFYVLLVLASFFIVMPSEAQSWIWVGGLLGIVFAISVTVAFRIILGKLPI